MDWFGWKGRIGNTWMTPVSFVCIHFPYATTVLANCLDSPLRRRRSSSWSCSIRCLPLTIWLECKDETVSLCRICISLCMDKNFLMLASTATRSADEFSYFNCSSLWPRMKNYILCGWILLSCLCFMDCALLAVLWWTRRRRRRRRQKVAQTHFDQQFFVWLCEIAP